MQNRLCMTALVLVWGVSLGVSRAEGRGVAKAARSSFAPVGSQGTAGAVGTMPAVSGAGAAGSQLDSTACVPDWIATFGGLPGADSQVRAMAVFDDGGGAALFVGGLFTSAGGVEASRIARWDGSAWSPLGSGLDGEVLALAVFDDGGGPALYVGGRFTSAGGVPANRIAKWDGSSWSPLGLGVMGYPFPAVHGLAVHDDGSGPALFVGGRFAGAGLVAASCVARWDGSAWSALGDGINPDVLALTVHDDGGGARLYAGGTFTGGGSTAFARVARWDGTAWSPVGLGTNGPVHALASFDDGSGPALYAGGLFTSVEGAPASRVAKWDGSAWSALGSGLTGTSTPYASALLVHDDGQGGGPALHVTGVFTSAGGIPASRIARWDGSSWSALGAGILGEGSALVAHDEGQGSVLFVGGGMKQAGSATAHGVARWDGSSWSALDGRAQASPDDWVYAVETFDDGSGPALFVGGSFRTAGGVATRRIARWDGSSWSAVGGGMDDGAVLALAPFDDGTGPALYVGGSFTSAGGIPAQSIARWDGSGWSPVGGGLNDEVLVLHVFDDGNGARLYAGGWFLQAGGTSAVSVARWDGTSWSALGSGLSFGVRALVGFDDGSGPALYAGGFFSNTGGTLLRYLARWDGSSWTAVGGTVDSRVEALAVHDDGSGPALYAAGFFATIGGTSASRIARWDGSAWSAVGLGLDTFIDTSVQDLAVFDDGAGAGPALYAGGAFNVTGAGDPARRIAKWDGASWSALGSGLNGQVITLGVIPAGQTGGPALVAGGRFTASPAHDSYIARWGCASPSIGYAYCFGDGSGTACPCANAGGSAEGCANSTGAGAVLGASGSNGAGANDLVLHARRVPALQPGLLFVGNVESNGGSGFTFGDGLRCSAFGVRRLGVSIASAGGHASWGPGLGALGGWIAGDTRRFQIWYRDPIAGPCGSGFNLTNGYGVTFVP